MPDDLMRRIRFPVCEPSLEKPPLPDFPEGATPELGRIRRPGVPFRLNTIQGPFLFLCGFGLPSCLSTPTLFGRLFDQGELPTLLLRKTLTELARRSPILSRRMEFVPSSPWTPTIPACPSKPQGEERGQSVRRARVGQKAISFQLKG